MRENLIVKKDFLNLKKGDEIRVSTDCDGCVYFDALNRMQLVRYYGNEKGRWGKDNPSPRNGNPTFMLVSEFCGIVNLIQFGKPPQKPPHPRKELYTAEGIENWGEKYLDKIINDLIELGVCEKKQ